MTPPVLPQRRLFWNSNPLRAGVRSRLWSCGDARLIPAPARWFGTFSMLIWATTACASRNPTVNESTLPMCADAGGTYQEDAVEPANGQHTEQPQPYDGRPPTGGPHSGCWGTWGVHSTPLQPERFVHNLEHGGVVLTYNCPEGCPKELLWLQEFALTHELVVLTEYPDLTSRFGISAWNARAYSDCMSPQFVRDFYARRVDRGPERFSRPPPGPPSSCQ